MITHVAVRYTDAVPTYAYRAANGVPRYMIDYVPRRGSDISIHIRHPGDDDTRHRHLTPGMALPYRLPELTATPAGATVWIAPSEADADALAGLDMHATAYPARHYYHHLAAADLAGRHAVIIPGPPARSTAHHVERLRGALDQGDVLSVAVVPVPGHGWAHVARWLDTPGHEDQLDTRLHRSRLVRAGITGDWPSRADRERLLWRTPWLTSAERLTLTYIARKIGFEHGGPAYRGHLPTARDIATATGVHRVTAQNAVMRLRRLGLLADSDGGWWLAWDILAVSTGRKQQQ